MPTAPCGATLTHWRSWGNGARRAVAIHCSLASSGAWAGVAAALADCVTLEAFDLPGHGQSADWDTARDFGDQATDMAVGLIGDGPVDLIGHSFGAVIALRVAVERPDLVRSLVLYEPVFFAAAGDVGRNAGDLMGGFGSALAAGDRDAAARLFTDLWGNGTPWNQIPAAQRAALASRIHLIPAGTPTLFDDRPGLLRAGRLERVTVPTLLLRGAQAHPITAAINDALARRLPQARCEEVEGAGHMGPVTHPDAVGRAIRAHLGC